LITTPYVLSKLTGKEYIQLVTKARQITITNIEDKNIFNLPLDSYATTYSTGMKKKLALTAILLQNNAVYIFDEPFNGVDMQGNLIITEVIERLKSLGKTVLVSSHIFSTLKATCDTIIVLNNGRITKTVEASDFDDLEQEISSHAISGLIDKLDLK